jgi:uncharacterized protein YbcV (DUF1398 family)
MTSLKSTSKIDTGERQMSTALGTLQLAFEKAMAGRPEVGGFPYLAECLRSAGVSRNEWTLPSCQSLYVTDSGSVIMPGTPLVEGPIVVPEFDLDDLIRALRIDQAGGSTFPEFLAAAWDAGVVSYEVDFLKRTVSYYGSLGEVYVESYPAVEIS